MRGLRDGASAARDGGKLGLLYGQGGFVTKHHAAGAVARGAAAKAPLAQETSVQAEADARRGPVPDFVEAAPARPASKPSPCCTTATAARTTAW